MTPIFVMQLAAIALLAAFVWLGIVVVKFRRREHLYWIVPSLLSRVMAATASLTPRYWHGMIPGPLLSAIHLTFLGSGIMACLSIAALVVVVWKAVDQPLPENDLGTG